MKGKRRWAEQGNLPNQKRQGSLGLEVMGVNFIIRYFRFTFYLNNLGQIRGLSGFGFSYL